jgi:hypothetical protein
VRSRLWFGSLAAAAVAVSSCAPAAARPSTAPAPQSGAPATAAAPSGGAGSGGGGARAAGPRPYAQVIPARAVTDTGGITVHRVDERWFLEVPDSLVGRDFLMVGRVAATPANFGAYIPAGASVHERLVRWERRATA